ncbi:hypothetical protein B2D07_07185 [Desulfococcus multivorans]|jgi:hypothetical protein|uniref:YcxB-like protein domain-containing protein n=2 Tax=Desulfococcus multivorans TaxID=897 RepID=S7U0J9_DESML|nr:hypothetical protein [Desulfococcus multivorans]AOY58226.1 uncharacterized protein Dmul_14510 [Desulfococcus multivorans]AQV00572.1 hypothetical protein B2D07_07185 [Desulfococcus multivorans]EPR42520.1 hypothetical protein dsmv_1646 [Desulfococcus multivorans DSM 2059]SJZ96876.1 hypothetical protein SAMN02745446_02254 [Desulfococcus multivorans DSM 2059]
MQGKIKNRGLQRQTAISAFADGGKRLKAMDEKIRFRGYLTFADSLKVQKAMASQRRIPAFIVISVTTLVTTAFLIYWMGVGLMFGALLLMFMGVLMYGGLRLMRTTAAGTQKRVYEKACVKRTGALTESGITIRRNKVLSTLSWKAFERVLALEEIVVLLNGVETLGFAKYMFDTQSDWDRARRLILNRYDRRRADPDAT